MKVGPHHADLVVLLVQIVQQDVAQRNHAHQVSLVANRQMTETVAAHENHSGFEVVIGADRQGIIGHHFRHAGGSRVAIFGHDTAHQVALGKNPHQLSVVDHGNRADVAFDHRAYGFKDGVAKFRSIGVLVLDQFADKHFCLPGTEVRDAAHLPGREYMPK